MILLGWWSNLPHQHQIGLQGIVLRQNRGLLLLYEDLFVCLLQRCQDSPNQLALGSRSVICNGYSSPTR